jgi:hypothetical protein
MFLTSFSLSLNILFLPNAIGILQIPP